MSKSVIKVSKKLAIVNYNPTTGQSIAVTFGKGGTELLTDTNEAVGNDNKRNAKKSYYTRGDDDTRLLKMHKLANESPNKWQILETKANFISGGGLYLFDEDEPLENGFPKAKKSKEFKDWVKRLELKSYLRAGAYQLVFSDELNVLVSLDPKTKKVSKVKVIDNNDIRAEVISTNGSSVTQYWLSTDFGYKKSIKKEDVKPYPAFDPKEPTKYGDFIIHVHAEKPGQKIYGFASWWGTAAWSEISNQVPEYYRATFKNGIMITHHISVPEDYFYKEGQTEEQEEEEKKKWLDSIMNSLTDVENVNKCIVTFSQLASDGKSGLKEVKITPIESKLKDEAFIKMFDIANGVQLSGHGMPGVLSGIDHSNARGTSGREVIAQANYVQDFLTPFYRMMLLEPLEIIKDLDELEPDLELGIKRISSYTVDVTPKTDVSHPNNVNE